MSGVCFAGFQDGDGDGVPDFDDVCCDTPRGLSVDRQGRPIGDEDRDCDVDLDDVALLINNLTGPRDLEGRCRAECELNTHCPCDEYCVHRAGECDGVGVCEPRPVACPDIFDPVCGCDGQTYSNACDAAAAGVSIQYEGICRCRRNSDCRSGHYCQKESGDCDGFGLCEQQPTLCPHILEPVCGCDGRTYPNRCFAAAAGVNVEHGGACEDNRCELRPDPGKCDGAFPRYFFDPETRRCLPFVYGGCGGNANNFVTIEECQEFCAPIPTCKLPKDPGPCRAAIPRFWFNHESGQCEVFIYGGCEGNANNFETLDECERTCPAIDVCDLPVVSGPCDAYIPRWAFVARTGQCERFVYGGCGGNANNFESKERCEVACAPRDRCELPIESGDCRAVILRFAYNVETGDCEPFIYGGCGGNENNFETLEACKKRCDVP